MWGSQRVAEFIGAKYATLDHWIRSGLLSCTDPSNGTGNHRSWSPADVARAATIKELRQSGYSLQAIRRSKVLERLTDEAIGGGILVCTVGNVIGAVPDDEEWKQCIDCSDPPPSASAALWITKKLSRDLPLDQQRSVVVYVTDICEEASRQMKAEE